MNTHAIKYSSSLQWNSYGLIEYKLVINLDEKVNEKVLLEKQDFFNQYGEKIAVETKPHITIANFLAKEAMEETLNRWINNICNQYQNFELTLNNYSGIPPHTIYIRVQDPKPVINFVQQLKTLDNFIRSSDCPPLKASPKLHLTIAKKLAIDIYDKAIKKYSQKDFHESFMVKELVLLKRNHQFDICTTINKFRFAPGL
jgi:hypothetical protein